MKTSREAMKVVSNLAMEVMDTPEFQPFVKKVDEIIDAAVSEKLAGLYVAKDEANFWTDVFKPVKVLILYHSDLDGNGSCYSVINTLAAYDDHYINGDLDNTHGRHLFSINLFRINYNYDLDKINGLKEAIFEADIIYIVDYSIRENHIEWIGSSRNPNKSKIIWIDHHESSINEIKKAEVGKSSEVYTNFFNSPDVVKFVYTKVGVSATLLCWLAGIMSNMNHARTEIPELIANISLYDTFHTLSSREFYYATGMDNYDMQTAKEDLMTFDASEYRELYGGYVMKLCEKFNCLLDTDGITLHGATTAKVFNPFLNIPYNIPINRTLDKLLDKAHVVYQFDQNSHRILQTNTLFGITLILDNKEKYSMAVMNAKGNSFLFEDKYNIYDAVCLFYFNSYGTYTYSIFSNLNSSHPLQCNKVCEIYGGGGHKGAAGFTFKWNIFEDILPTGVWELHTED